MPSKKEETHSELLIRIDERVKVLPQMKQDIRDIKKDVAGHDTRLAVLEEDNKSNVHISKDGCWLGKILNVFLNK